MYEVAWTEIKNSGELVSKRKSFKTESARDRFVDKLFESGKLYAIIGYRN